jgi:hypothetical protein
MTSHKHSRSPRPTRPLEIVQIDHTLVDIMVVDEVQRESMRRPWVTVAFDVATRVVLRRRRLWVLLCSEPPLRVVSDDRIQQILKGRLRPFLRVPTFRARPSLGPAF